MKDASEYVTLVEILELTQPYEECFGPVHAPLTT